MKSLVTGVAVHIGNTLAVEAIMHIAAGEITKGSVFNMAGGTSTTVNEIIERLGEISETVPKVSRGAPVRSDVERTRAIEAATGWSPVVAMHDGSRNSTGGPPPS